LRNAELWTRLEGANLFESDMAGAKLSHPDHPEYGVARFDEWTVLPNGEFWTPETDMEQFIDPTHKNFWRSPNPRSPASHPREKIIQGD
jgi:hypothetical protein